MGSRPSSSTRTPRGRPSSLAWPIASARRRTARSGTSASGTERSPTSNSTSAPTRSPGCARPATRSRSDPSPSASGRCPSRRPTSGSGRPALRSPRGSPPRPDPVLARGVLAVRRGARGHRARARRSTRARAPGAGARRARHRGGPGAAPAIPGANPGRRAWNPAGRAGRHRREDAPPAERDAGSRLMDLTVAVALGAGLLSFLSPCVLPLVPAYVGQLSAVAVVGRADGRAPRWLAVSHALAYVVGFGAVFTILGITATYAAGPLFDYLPFLRQAAGVLLIVLGLNLAGVLRIPALDRTWRPLEAGAAGSVADATGTMALQGAGAGAR